MTIGTNNLEEEMVAMNAMLERLVKESEEKEARVKLQEEKITRLTRKLEKQLTQSIAKAQKVTRKRGCPSEVKLSTRRFTQRRAINSRIVGL